MCAWATTLESSSLEMSLTDIMLQADRGEKTQQPPEQVSIFFFIFFFNCQ